MSISTTASLTAPSSGPAPSIGAAADTADASGPYSTGQRRTLALLLALSVILVLGSIWVLALGLSEVDGFWLWLFPLVLLAGCFLAAAQLVWINSAWVTSPVVWSLLACGVYFGFGPLLFTFGDWRTIRDASRAFHVDSYWLYRTNLIDQLGLAALLGGVLIGSRITLPKSLVQQIQSLGDIKPEKAFLWVSAVGLAVKYSVDLPKIVGLLSWTPPTSLSDLRALTLVSILMAAYFSKTHTRYLVAFFFLFGLEISIDLLLNSKQVVLEVFIAAVVGRVLATRSRVLIVTASLTIPALLTVLAPVVTQSRLLGVEQRTISYGESIVTRFEIIVSAIEQFSQGNLDESVDTSQGWWLRLSYTPMQAFAVMEYDLGRPGSFVQVALWSLIPRFLWPDKPLINPGVHFSYLFDGNDQNSNAPGTFAEGYWNAGWFGVAAFGFYVGLVLATLHSVSTQVLARMSWLAMLFVLLGIRAGYRIDGWFAMEYVGAIVIYFSLLFLLLVLVGPSLLSPQMDTRRGGT